jgi:hypothetical protein
VTIPLIFLGATVPIFLVTWRIARRFGSRVWRDPRGRGDRRPAPEFVVEAKVAESIT